MSEDALKKAQKMFATDSSVLVSEGEMNALSLNESLYLEQVCYHHHNALICARSLPHPPHRAIK